MRLSWRLGMCAAVFVMLGAMPAYALPNVPISAWQTTVFCNVCHADFVTRWSKSMHAQAMTDPVYLYKIGQADAETSGSATAFCTTCHGPLATMAGEIHRTDLSGLSGKGAQGVSCEFCHHVTAATEAGTATIGNVSQVFTPDAAKHSQLQDPHSQGHTSAYNAVFDSAEFCGACHNVRHPTTGVVLEDTYGEWSRSSYAQAGITCQDCHMTAGVGIPPGPGKAALTAPERPKIYIMNWVGGNAVFGPAAEAIARLRSAAVLTLTAPTDANPGDTVPVRVRIDNVGAGHDLPTGITELRQMWLEVVATGSGGEILRQQHTFGTVVQDSAGDHPAEMWEAAAIYSDDRIPPNGSSESSWTLSVPSSGGPVRISAALYYRSFSPEIAAAAGLTQAVPTITMASAEATITSPRPASSITIRRSAVSLKRGKSVVLSGVCSPVGMVGATVRVDVKKPGRTTWATASRRTITSRAGVAAWTYTYGFKRSMPKGTYQFRAVYPGGAFLPSRSSTVKVSVK